MRFGPGHLGGFLQEQGAGPSLPPLFYTCYEGRAVFEQVDSGPLETVGNGRPFRYHRLTSMPHFRRIEVIADLSDRNPNVMYGVRRAFTRPGVPS